MSTAVPVIGFVIEAIQQSVSGVIGRLAATSAMPLVSKCSTLSFVTTIVTAPAISCFAIHSSIVAPTPGSFGSSAMAECVRPKAAVTATEIATERMAAAGRRENFIGNAPSCDASLSLRHAIFPSISPAATNRGAGSTRPR